MSAVPRINAESVAAHVAQQERAVFDAAVRLFTERGYANVSLADIAAAVGLARNSLYRYFPDKAHILLRWFRHELAAQAERSATLLAGDGPPVERIHRWALAQLDYAGRAEHRLVAAFDEILPNLDATARAELANSHRRLTAPLAATVAAANGAGERTAEMIAELIGGIVVAAAGQEARTGHDRLLREAVLRAVDATLDG